MIRNRNPIPQSQTDYEAAQARRKLMSRVRYGAQRRGLNMSMVEDGSIVLWSDPAVLSPPSWRWVFSRADYHGDLAGALRYLEAGLPEG